MENASDSNAANTTITFYCHVCQSPQHCITDRFNCPTCNSGFIEKMITQTPTLGNQDNSVPLERTQTLPQVLPYTSGSLSFTRNLTENRIGESGEPILQNPARERDITLQMHGREEAFQMRSEERDNLWLRHTQERDTAFREHYLRIANQNNRAFFSRHQHRGQESQNRFYPRDFPMNHPQSRGNTLNRMRSSTDELLFHLMPGNRDFLTGMFVSFTSEEGDPPASNTDIQGIPSVRISQDHLDMNLQCHICIELFSLDEEVLKLVCNHMYHRQCIIPWITRHATCPVCRQFLLRNRLRPLRRRGIQPRAASTLNFNVPLSLESIPRNLNSANSQESGIRNESTNNLHWAGYSRVPSYQYYGMFGAHGAPGMLYLDGDVRDQGSNFPQHQSPNEILFNHHHYHHYFHPGLESNPNMQSGRHYHRGVDVPVNTGHRVNEPANTGNMVPDHRGVNVPANTDNVESDHGVGNEPAKTSNVESDRVVNEPTNTDNVKSDHRVGNEPANTSNVESDRVINEPANTSNVESDQCVVNDPAKTSNVESDRVVNEPANTGNVESDQRVVDEPANTDNVESDHRVVEEPANSRETAIVCQVSDQNFDFIYDLD